MFILMLKLFPAYQVDYYKVLYQLKYEYISKDYHMIFIIWLQKHVAKFLLVSHKVKFYF